MQNTKESDTKRQTVSILGCGWLGSPLAQYLLKKKYKVKGSTTSEEKLEELESAGVEPYKIRLEESIPVPTAFLDSDILVLNIPPGLRRNSLKTHLKQLESLFSSMQKDKPGKLLFVSSTSVYENKNREMTEADVNRDSDIYKIEEYVREECLRRSNSLTILRCGGLMGHDRIPCKYYSGKTNLTLANTPVNYIHRDDVIGIIHKILNLESWGQVFNAVSPEHPLRKDIIDNCCQRTSFTKPTYAEEEKEDFKIISSARLIEQLSYKFKYPNPLEYPYEESVKA